MTTVGIVSWGGVAKVCSDSECPLHKFQGLHSSDAPVHVLLPEGSQFDDHHSFIVRYTASEDLGLDMHTDDSAPCLHFRYSRIPRKFRQSSGMGHVAYRASSEFSRQSFQM